MVPVVPDDQQLGPDELAVAIARNEMDDDTLGEIARRYGMEVIGPVPEGYV